MEEANYYWVYILTCNDGSMYVGMTNNIVMRYAQHVNKTAKCKYTRRRDKHPLKLSLCWQVYGNRGDAIKVELFIKKGRRSLKDQLLKNPHSLEELFVKGREYNLRITNYDDIEYIEDMIKEKIV